MKCLLLIALLAFTTTRCAEAAPPCFPGEPNAFEHDLQIMQNANGCVAYVHCDMNHKWVKYMLAGNWITCRAALASASIAEWVGLTHEQKAALYDQAMTAAIADPEDAALLEKAKSTAYPFNPPPSGLVMQDTKVYKLSTDVNKITWQLVGTAPLGTPCDASQRIGPYHRIDRTKVQYPKGVLMPLVTYALCQP